MNKTEAMLNAARWTYDGPFVWVAEPDGRIKASNTANFYFDLTNPSTRTAVEKKLRLELGWKIYERKHHGKTIYETVDGKGGWKENPDRVTLILQLVPGYVGPEGDGK